jgi:hypothetical protein
MSENKRKKDKSKSPPLPERVRQLLELLKQIIQRNK